MEIQKGTQATLFSSFKKNRIFEMQQRRNSKWHSEYTFSLILQKKFCRFLTPKGKRGTDMISTSIESYDFLFFSPISQPLIQLKNYFPQSSDKTEILHIFFKVLSLKKFFLTLLYDNKCSWGLF